MTLGVLVIIIVGGFILFFTSAGRKLLATIIVFLVLAVWGYNQLMNQVNRAQQSVSASVDSAASIPSRMLAAVQNKIKEFFGDGGKIMEPLTKAADLKVELYEYCLADVTWVRGKVNPGQCQALPPGRDRTTCFEGQLASITSYDGIFDRDQVDSLKAVAKNSCNTRFNVQDAMGSLLGAGVRGVGQLYRYCEIPGACEESDFDNAPYRDCLQQKFIAARPEGLGLTGSFCGVFRAPADREKWRKCVEVSMVQQTAGVDMALMPNDPNQPAIRAIRSCRQL